jgi:glycosyltransferase involved in cell wall biosynthesis
MSSLQNQSASKIAITIDWYLPGTNSGGPVSSVSNLVAALPEIDFYILTRNTDYCSNEPYFGIIPNQWLKQGENVWVYYFSEDQLSKGKLRAVIQDIQVKVLYVNGIYSRKFSQWPVGIGNELGLKTIVAARGMLSPHALAVKSFKKLLFLSFMRWMNAYSNVLFHATSEEEKADIKHVISKLSRVIVLPNVAREKNSNVIPIQKEKDVLRLVYVGRIAPEKGTLNAIKALKEQTAAIELNIYGQCYNPDYWENCQREIKHLPKNVQVHYHGPCPSNEVELHIIESHALLLPSEGENYGHAIIESLGQGRPVIISKNTPWKNLVSVQAGFDCDPNALSESIKRLASFDQETFNVWSEGATNYYKQHIELPMEATKNEYLKHFEN